MTRLPSRFPVRLAAWLVGALVLAAASAVGFRAGSLIGAASRSQAVPPVLPQPAATERAGTPDNRADLPVGPPPLVARHRPRRGPDEEADDSAMFLALERLERRRAAGMTRARDSVVALEYSAAESPPGSRRLATGVVINATGDVLSVRIDPPPSVPLPSPSPGPGPASPAEAPAPAPAILARDTAGRRHVAQWVAGDPETGLTLLRIAAGAVKPIEIATEGPVLGSQVFVVGNPLGLHHSVSRGHVAGLDRALRLGPRQVGGLIQLQAPLYPGDSGAVVTNLRGQLLAVVRSAMASPMAPGDRDPAHAEPDNRFGFAIGIRDLLWLADQLRARGRVDRAYLGVRLVPASEDPGATTGAFLQDVLAGSPAAAAGLRAGDAIVGIDGEPIQASPDLTDRLDRLPARATVHLDVLRGAGLERRRLKVVLQSSSRPDVEQAIAPIQASVSGTGAPAAPVTIIPTAAPAARPAPAPATTKPAAGPLRAPVPAAQPEELKLTLPRAVSERLDVLERRLEQLERQGKTP